MLIVEHSQTEASSPLSLVAFIFILVALLLCGCQKKSEPKQSIQTFRIPSAGELFDFESKCNVMGQKIIEANAIGAALTQSQVSHYNPSDNRCYVLLNVTSADLRTPFDQMISDSFLDDGQTGEILATIYCKGRNCTADVTDDSLKEMVKDPSLPSETKVRDLMDKFVHTDRHLRQEETQ